MKLLIIILLIISLGSCGQGNSTDNDSDGHSQQTDSHDHGSESQQEHSGEGDGHDHAAEGHSEDEGKNLELSPEQQKELGIKVAPVTASTGQSTGVRPGHIVADPDGKVLLSSQVSGTLTRFHVQIGANVEAGTVVAEIESPEVTALQSEYHEAEVEAELAAKELNNTRSLLEVADDVRRPLETARLELAKARAEQQAAEARLKSAALKNDRLETLLKEGIASRQQVEESRAQRQALKAEAEQAKAAVEIADNHLVRETRVSKSRLRIKAETFPAEARLARASETMRHARERLHQLGASPQGHGGRVLLHSPIPGQVVERPLTRGELVGPGTSVATIVDTSKLWVWIDLQRNDLDLVKVGAPIQLSLVERPDVTQDARLDYLDPQVEETTQTIRARVVLSNPSKAFRLGSFVNARVSEGAGQSGPAVPQSAIQFVEGQTVVYVQHDHGFARTPVKLGASVGDAKVGVTGVTVGQKIVVQGAEQLKSMDLSDAIGGHSH